MRIERYRGDTYPIRMTLNKKVDGATSPVDLTGSTVVMSIGLASGKETIDAAVIDAVNGKVQFPLTPSQVSTVGISPYDVQLTDAAGYITTFVKDDFVLIKDLT